jgi:hypothetical protein
MAVIIALATCASLIVVVVIIVAELLLVTWTLGLELEISYRLF